MIEQVSVAVFVVTLLCTVIWVTHQIAWWVLRTPRAGYLLLVVFALYILTRTLQR